MNRAEHSLPTFVPFGAPHFSKQEERAVLETLRSGWVGMGPKTIAFEGAFGAYVGARQAVAVSSCTAALHLSLLASGVGPGDEVITTPLTFIATANAILQTGATVKFADVDLSTYNLSPASVEKVINKKTRALLPVHFAGLPADLRRFGILARKHRLVVIEDAAHALGGRYEGKNIGASGNLVCFSFYPNKNITTNDGGMITLSNARLANQLRVLRLHGLDSDAWRRFHRRSLKTSLAVRPGFKYNLNDIQAAIGLEQLKRLEGWQRTRERYAAMYDHFFQSIPGVHIPYRPTNRAVHRHALHLYTLRLDQKFFGRTRDRVVQTLLRRNIGASVHYVPVHLHPLFRRLGYRRGDFPIAERIGDEIFTLPLTPHLTAQTIKAIGRITRTIIVSHQR